MTDLRHLAPNLRRYRLKRRLTQSEIARRVGVPQQRVSELERGLLPHDATFIEVLAGALDVSPSSLLRRV